MSDSSNSHESKSAFWLNTIGFLGIFLVFAMILGVVYLPGHQGAPVVSQPADDPVPRTPEARKAKLEEITASASKAASKAEVIDPAKGVVRLPLERAMEITIAEQSGKRP